MSTPSRGTGTRERTYPRTGLDGSSSTHRRVRFADEASGGSASLTNERAPSTRRAALPMSVSAYPTSASRHTTFTASRSLPIRGSLGRASEVDRYSPAEDLPSSVTGTASRSVPSWRGARPPRSSSTPLRRDVTSTAVGRSIMAPTTFVPSATAFRHGASSPSNGSLALYLSSRASSPRPLASSSRSPASYSRPSATPSGPRAHHRSLVPPTASLASSSRRIPSSSPTSTLQRPTGISSTARPSDTPIFSATPSSISGVMQETAPDDGSDGFSLWLLYTEQVEGRPQSEENTKRPDVTSQSDENVGKSTTSPEPTISGTAPPPFRMKDLINDPTLRRSHYNDDPPFSDMGPVVYWSTASNE